MAAKKRTKAKKAASVPPKGFEAIAARLNGETANVTSINGIVSVVNTQSGSQAQIVSITGAQFKQQKVRWMLDGMIPMGFPTLLTGEGQLGKSTVCGAIVAALTGGVSVPGIDPRMDSDAVWLAAEEDPAAVIIPRLEAHGADVSRVHFPGWIGQGEASRRLRLPSQAPLLRDYLIRTKAGLLIIDPIGSFLDPEAYEDSGGTARNIMQSLADVSRAAKCAILVVKHPRKGGQGSAMDQVSGSKEWVNVPRVVLVIARHPNEEKDRVLACVKNNLGGIKGSVHFRFETLPEGHCVKWLGDCHFEADDVFGPSLDAVERSALDEAKFLLLDRLAIGPKPAKDMVKATEDAGLKLATVRRAKKALRITSHSVGPNENRYTEWRLPDQKGG